MHTISRNTGPRQVRERSPDGRTLRLRKPVVALVLAGGRPHPEFGSRVPPFRALLPVGGRPIVSYTLAALEASAVERILVFHDAACDLAAHVKAGLKTTFMPRPEGCGALAGGFVDGLRHAVETTVRACGLDAVRGRRLLVLPCDLPFVTAAILDRVLERSDILDFDFAYTAVSRSLLARRFPGRRFHSFPVADLGGRYALQSVCIMDGASFGLAGGGGHFTYLDWTPEEYQRFQESVGALRMGRGNVLQMPRALHELVLRRLPAPGRLRAVAGLLLRVLAGRLRTTDLDRLALAAFRVRTLCIDTEAPELSADMDRPSDLSFCGLTMP